MKKSPFNFPAKHLDNNFWVISQSQAMKLCGGKPPKFGFERCVTVNFNGDIIRAWLCRTVNDGRPAWAVRVRSTIPYTFPADCR